MSHFNPTLKDAYVLVGLTSLTYQETFALYNRNTIYISSGLKLKTLRNIHFSSEINFKDASYPSYNGTLSVDNRDLNGYLGINASLSIPLALDAKAGLQMRHYGDLGQAVNTLFSFGTIRLSGPLGDRMGASLRLQVRKQASPDNNELQALYIGGIDPGDLLWDGWYVKPQLNRILGSWRASLSAGYKKANYLEASVVNGRQQRVDEQTFIGLGAKRVVTLSSMPVKIWFIVDYSFVNNLSTDSYYTYTSNSLRISLTLEPQF